MIPDIYKTIYNLYLKAYRKNNNQPFRSKKKFDDIAGTDKELQLLKLSAIFQKYPHLMRDEFFDAPYKLYGDSKKYYGLDFYSSHKGLTACVKYFNFMAESTPNEQLDYLRESMKFVAAFCIENNIPLQQYVNHKTVVRNTCLKHLKEHKVSWYCIFVIPGLYEFLHKLPDDEFALYFGSELDLNTILNNYNGAKTAKEFLEKITKKLQKYIEKTIKIA